MGSQVYYCFLFVLEFLFLCLVCLFLFLVFYFMKSIADSTILETQQNPPLFFFQMWIVCRYRIPNTFMFSLEYNSIMIVTVYCCLMSELVLDCDERENPDKQQRFLSLDMVQFLFYLQDNQYIDIGKCNIIRKQGNPIANFEGLDLFTFLFYPDIPVIYHESYILLTDINMLKSSSRTAFAFFDYFTIEHKNNETFQTILRDNQNNKLILMREIECVTDQEADQTAKTLANQKKLSHQQLLSLLDSYSQPKYNKFIVFYEYCQFSLNDEFESRIAQRRIFQQSELWSILTSLIFGLEYLQINNVGHGSVSLYDSYLNDCGFVKICDPTFANTNPFIFTPGYFYSPEIVEQFRNGSEEFDSLNIFKSDVFCLGCCILELTLMRSIRTQILDEETMEISSHALDRLLEELLYSNFSDQYIDFLYDMLTVEVDDRPDFTDLKLKIYRLLELDIPVESDGKNENTKISDVAEIIKNNANQKSITSSLQKSLTNENFVPAIINKGTNNSIKNDKQRMLNSLKRLQQVYNQPPEDSRPFKDKTNAIINKKSIVMSTRNSMAQLKTVNKYPEYDKENRGSQQSEISIKNVPFIEQDVQFCCQFNQSRRQSYCPREAKQLEDTERKKKSFGGLQKKKMENSSIYRQTAKQSSQCYTDPNFLSMMKGQVDNIMKKRQKHE